MPSGNRGTRVGVRGTVLELPAPVRVTTLLCTAPLDPSPGSRPYRGLRLTDGWGCEFGKVCEGPDPKCKIVEPVKGDAAAPPPSTVPSPRLGALLSSSTASVAPFSNPLRTFPKVHLIGASDWPCWSGPLAGDHPV